MASGPEVLWEPDPSWAAASQLKAFESATRAAWGFDGGDTYDDLWRWSVAHRDRFWAAAWDFFGLPGSGDRVAVLPPDDGRLPSGRDWFSGVRCNYAEQLFAGRAEDRPALVALAEEGDPVEVPWAELAGWVAALADRLRAWGVRPGDRVGAYLTNGVPAVVGLLATAAVGAVWSCCSPDYGSQAVIARLAQIEPTVLIACSGYRWAGRWRDRSAELATIAEALPSVRRVVAAGDPAGAPAGAVAWDDAVAGPAELHFEPVPFDHPLWVLYSSGTTGLPKGIVHGHGGITVEHQKWLRLQNDVRPGDRFFWHTSTAWMVWNVLVSSLGAGASAVLYDGSPAHPGPDAVWAVADRTRATYLGTSAGYITASHKKGLEPGRDLDLSGLRCVMSTGSPLPADEWRWVYGHVDADVWLDAPSGGTDVCSAYVGACPTKPVVAGEMQARFLGTPVEAWSADGRPVIDEVGELVITAALPSMPLGLWGDTSGERYQDAYFDQFPGTWRHGDWTTITGRGTVVIHGRSDTTINRHGVRMGSADIYAAVERLPEVRDCLIVGVEQPDGGYWLPLFVVVDGELDDDLRDRINDTIRTTCSSRHVPDEIIAVAVVPRTLTGKRLELPVKRLLQGMPLDKAVDRDVVDDPDALEGYRRLAAGRPAPGT
jgi:acetoacetyl-CoA synthetase